jgi:1-phosphatidylinositol-4-phosphate 5-kinase
VIKTVNTNEFLSLWLRILSPYAKHILENENSLLARIYGLYKVSVEGYKDVLVIVMENTFEELINLGKIDRIYDLKGSLKSRFV